MKKTLMRSCFMLITMSCFAQKAPNAQLQDMADQDQNSRFGTTINWTELNRQDSLRRVQVYELLKTDKIQTAKDFFNVGIILHHGKDSIDSKRAVESFAKAIAMDSSLNKWWYAAALDRDLMRRDKPQIYGTQTIYDDTTHGKFKRYKMDSTKVTDAQRNFYGVKTLAEQRERGRVMNLKSIFTYYKDHPNLDQIITLIKREFKKQTAASYNVNEQMINGLGYLLLNKDQPKEALRIFKLNTTLYPNASNTYDSYGECLLKLNRTQDALTAYRKSLELNPENQNAKTILNQFK